MKAKIVLNLLLISLIFLFSCLGPKNYRKYRKSVGYKNTLYEISSPSAKETSAKNSGYTNNSDSKLAHLLTAGEINDFTKWVLWNDITMSELKQYATLWGILPESRFCVQLTNKAENPVVDAKVKLVDSKNKVVWEARTDNTGKAELWAGLFSDKKDSLSSYSIQIEYQKNVFKINKAIPFNQGVNVLKLPVACESSNNVDVMFVVDATGSMTDEIKYLKAELLDIITNVQSLNKNLVINLGSVFYRDKGDQYITRKSDLSSTISQTISFIDKQDAGGGGDYEEALEEALNEAVANCKWSSEARTRILFLILDAPPHANSDVLKKLESIISIAAQKGIRIVPIAGSGVSKSSEYLFRSMALATNGTYTFLTDDSGIGDSHIKPTTDTYKVELLNDLLLRLFKQYTYVPICEKPVEFTQSDLQQIPIDSTNSMILPDSLLAQDSTKVSIEAEVKPNWKYYPNPTSGLLNVEIKSTVFELFITDNSGKILQRVEVKNPDRIFLLDLATYPNGIYFVRYYYQKGKSVVGKVVLTR
jgi:hypothetical protein